MKFKIFNRFILFSSCALFLSITLQPLTHASFQTETLVNACLSSSSDADATFTELLRTGVNPYETVATIQNLSAIVACTMQGKLSFIQIILAESGPFHSLPQSSLNQLNLAAGVAENQEKFDILTALTNYGANPELAAQYFSVPTFEKNLNKLARQNPQHKELWTYIRTQLIAKRVNRGWYPFSASMIPGCSTNPVASCYDLLTCFPKLFCTLPVGLGLRSGYYSYQHVARLIAYSLADGDIRLPTSTVVDNERAPEEYLYTAQNQKEYFEDFVKQINAQLGFEFSADVVRNAVATAALKMKNDQQFYSLSEFTKRVRDSLD